MIVPNEPPSADEWQYPQPTTASDAVNRPKHYTSSPARCGCGEAIECIQVVQHMPFCLGNAVKYIWRADLKHDDGGIQDLRKAAWYIQREIERRGGDDG